MSNNKDFKVKNGIQPTSYFEGVGTVTSGSVLSIPNMSASGNTLSVASQDSNPQGIALKPDGSRFFVIGNSSNAIYQYTMSTAYDLSTASYDSVSFSFSSQTTNIRDLAVSSNGLNLYVLDATSDVAYQYALSTAWDLSTASYASKSFSFDTQDTAPIGLSISSNGLYMYMGGGTNNSVFQYSLSTAYDVSTASYDNNSYSVGVGDPDAVYISSDGKTLVYGQSTDDVTSLSLSTPYDLSTATASGSYSAGSEFDTLRGLSVGESDNKIYIVSNGDDLVTEYTASTATATLDLSTGSVFEVTPTSDIQVTLSNPADSGTVSSATLLLDGGASVTYDIAGASYGSVSFSVASQDTSPSGMTFNNDGTKMYVSGGTNDSVYQYTLSTGFDLSTASYDSVSFSFNSQDAAPRGITFNNDGTSLYMVGGVSNTVYQYTLSTAYDASTLSYASKSVSVAAQDSVANSVIFNADGTKMYMVGQTGDSVYQYSLSTAFDVSTATYDSVSFSVASQLAAPRNAAFNNDGSKIYVTGATAAVHQYSLSTPYDLSTMTYDSVSFSVSQDTAPYAVYFNTGGTKMYVVGSSSDSVYQYTVGSEATITYDTAIEWPSGTAPTSPAIGETDVIAFNTRDGGITYSGVLAIDGAS